MGNTCKCQDSGGVVCGKEMTHKEVEQDGMCQTCADHVWNEMVSESKEYSWFHDKTPTLDKD